MLPGFSFLLGLGALFVGAASAKPRPVQETKEITQLRDFLYDTDNEIVLYNTRLHLCVPLDYPPLTDDVKKSVLIDVNDFDFLKGKIRVYWTQFARYYDMSVPEARYRYFKWRCEKEGIPYDSQMIWRFVRGQFV